jgi:hypothetical protein
LEDRGVAERRWNRRRLNSSDAARRHRRADETSSGNGEPRTYDEEKMNEILLLGSVDSVFIALCFWVQPNFLNLNTKVSKCFFKIY